MLKLAEVLDKIQTNQATIDVLLSSGKISVRNIGEVINDSKWQIETLYSQDDCTIGFASCERVDGLFPDHIHKDVKEYLMCVKGSFMESFGANGVDGLRVVKEGECVSIPPNIVHASKPLMGGTKMVFVCVPCDHTIPKVTII